MYVANTPLSPANISRMAPAIAFGNKRETLSDNYGFVSSNNLIDFANDLGFLPVQVGQAKSKKQELASSAKHFVRLRHERDFGKPEAVDILLRNSHDGTSAVKLQLGIFRLVCSNGLVVGQSFKQFSVTHLNLSEDTIKDAMTGIFDLTPKILERVEVMKNITVDKSWAYEVLSHALKLRLGYDEDKSKIIEGEFKTLSEQALRLRRHADSESSVWNFYNRLQENLQGRLTYADRENRRWVTLPAIKTMSRSVDLSGKLDNLVISSVPELQDYVIA